MECVPKSCPSCVGSQFSILSLNCQCICKECLPSEFLCTTSKVCIAKENVCDGIEHCLEDEKDCDIKIVTTPPTVPSHQRFSFEGVPCPPAQCGAGLSPVETEVETLDGCPYYKCLNRNTPPTCPTPTCPPGSRVQLIKQVAPMKLTLEDQSVNNRTRRYAIIEEELDCPAYECVEVDSQEEDGKCSYSGHSLTTLDGMVARADLCHHTLLSSEDGDMQIECKF